MTKEKSKIIFFEIISLFLILFFIPCSYSTAQIINQTSYLAEGRYFIQLDGKDFYLAVNNPVKSGSYQKAFFGSRDYIQADAGRYSKEVWIKSQPVSNGFFIISKFGEVDSYLHVDGLVKSSSWQRAYFSSGSYLSGKSNYQSSFWLQWDNINRFKLFVGQDQLISNFGTQQFDMSSYAWGYFFGQSYSKTKYLSLQFTKLDDKNVEQCQQSDALDGNSASFYMTSDPQFDFGDSGNGGRQDGELNADKTYFFLGSQVEQSQCPQSFIGVAGDLNHELQQWQQEFFVKFSNKYNNKQIIADILGNHDRKRLPKESMIEKTEQQMNNVFYWNRAVQVRYVQRSTTYFQQARQSVYNRIPATFYTLQLRNKKNPKDLVAYVIMTHNQIQKNMCYLYIVQNKADFNKTVPIILVGHAIQKYTDQLTYWINRNRVAAILTGHYFCGDAFHNDHCDRRSSKTYINFFNNTNLALAKQDIPYINTSGVRDRVFWSISVNNTNITLTRKAWTNNNRLPGFEVQNEEIRYYKF